MPLLEVAESLRAAFRADKFHCPRRRACIEARLAQALEATAYPDAGKSEWKQVNRSGQGATGESGEKCHLAAAPVGNGPGD